MTIYIGVVSQKGGVGKSTISRMIAAEYAKNDWSVKIADLDISQGTSFSWQQRRLQNEIEPAVSVEQFGKIEQALKMTNAYDLVVFDGAPHSTAATLKIAQASDLVVLPTGLALDDLEPSVLLAHELVNKSIDRKKIVFALCRVGNSEPELNEASEYIKMAGYTVAEGHLPEKPAFRRASDIGHTVTETRFKSLNEKADLLAQSLIDLTTDLTGD